MQEKVKRGIPIGVPTVILLLTVLGLTVFAVLSIRAAYGELKRAESASAALSRYYTADSRATEIEFRIREILTDNVYEGDAEITEALKSIAEIKSVENGAITYEVPITEETSVVCTLKTDAEGRKLSVSGRQYTVKAQSGYNHGLLVIETEIVE